MAVIFGIDTANLFKKKGAPAPKDGDEKKGALGKSLFNDAKLVRKVVITSSLVFFIFGGYFFFISPSLNKQENQILEIEKWNEQILSCDYEIENLKKEVEDLNQQKLSKSGLFVTDDEFEAFYADLTEASVLYRLTIRDITRSEEVPVRQTAQPR
jgi:cell division protein FtsL